MPTTTLRKEKQVYESAGVVAYWTADPPEQTVELCENSDAGFELRAKAKKAGSV